MRLTDVRTQEDKPARVLLEFMAADLDQSCEVRVQALAALTLADELGGVRTRLTLEGQDTRAELRRIWSMLGELVQVMSHEGERP